MAVLARYFAMGGYAVFVWPAYGIAITVLGGMTAYFWRRYRASCRVLEGLQRANEGER